MDFKILSLYILGCFLVVPSIFIISDLGRISIFLFYEKEKKKLAKENNGTAYCRSQNLRSKKHSRRLYPASKYIVILLPW